jgi:hypothetical protein
MMLSLWSDEGGDEFLLCVCYMWVWMMDGRHGSRPWWGGGRMCGMIFERAHEESSFFSVSICVCGAML